MAFPTQEPTVEDDDGPLDGKVYKHPAYGQISVSRVSGGANLYGSDFQHNNYIVVRIAESEFKRSLSRDWYHSRREFVEVALSESQWATFVSSFNLGAGVPCTIQRREGKSVPGIPHRDEGQEYKVEADKALKDVISELQGLRSKLQAAATGLSKKKEAELLAEVNQAIRSASQSLPFVADSFSQFMEERVEKAKVEVHGYTMGVLQRAGMDAIAQQPGYRPPLQIGKDEGDDG